MRQRMTFGQIRRLVHQAISRDPSEALSSAVMECVAAAAVAACEYWLDPGTPTEASLLASAAELIESTACEADPVGARPGRMPIDPVSAALAADDEMALDVLMLGPLSAGPASACEYPSFAAWAHRSGEPAALSAVSAYRVAAQACDRQTFTALAWLAAARLRAAA